ncbi:hypothetical protein [Actinacidiphila rubida]|nr:hypothetical protein [Actinacidiphila rubida]
MIAALPDTRKAVLVAMLQGAAWKFGSALASAISELLNRLH